MVKKNVFSVLNQKITTIKKYTTFLNTFSLSFLISFWISFSFASILDWLIDEIIGFRESLSSVSVKLLHRVDDSLAECILLFDSSSSSLTWYSFSGLKCFLHWSSSSILLLLTTSKGVSIWLDFSMVLFKIKNR